MTPLVTAALQPRLAEIALTATPKRLARIADRAADKRRYSDGWNRLRRRLLDKVSPATFAAVIARLKTHPKDWADMPDLFAPAAVTAIVDDLLRE